MTLMAPYSGPSHFGQNRPAGQGGPNGVQRSYASELKEHESLFDTYEHLQGLARGDAALTMLRKVASMVKPIMRKRGWRVQVLAEFLPAETNLLGLNINRGYKICIRLRYHNNPDLFLPLEQVVDTMLHELSHNVWGAHDAKFHALWDELRDEHETLLIKGFTGEGFLGQGRKLGGPAACVPAPRDMRGLARASAEKRKAQGALAAGSGRRLGGNPLHHGQDVREVIAGQSLLRTTINRGCGSGRTDADELAGQSGRQTFKTNAGGDDADGRAIDEALFDLMEAEEAAKLNGTFQAAPTDGGLAWSREHGLYRPESDGADGRAILGAAALSEDEQMRWALEESARLSSRGDADTGGMPPESLVSPVSPVVSRRARPESGAYVSPVSPQPGRSEASQTVHNRASEPEASRSKAVAALRSPAVDISEPFNPDEWCCEICTCVNPTQYLACDACGTERSQSVTAQSSLAHTLRPSTSTVETPVQSRDAGLGWNCGHCGAFMEHRWWTCSACGVMKASS